MPEVHVRDHDILLEVLPPTEVFPPRPDRLRPSLEDDVQLRSDEVRVQDEERVLDRPRGQDLVEERLARRGRGADDREGIGSPKRIRFCKLREERIIANQEPELPEVRLRKDGLRPAAEVKPLLEPPQVGLLVEERRRELREGDPHALPPFARALPSSRARSFITRIPHVERKSPNPRNGRRTRNRMWISGIYVRKRIPDPPRITPIAAQYCQGRSMSMRLAPAPHR